MPHATKSFGTAWPNSAQLEIVDQIKRGSLKNVKCADSVMFAHQATWQVSRKASENAGLFLSSFSV